MSHCMAIFDLSRSRTVSLYGHSDCLRLVCVFRLFSLPAVVHFLFSDFPRRLSWPSFVVLRAPPPFLRFSFSLVCPHGFTFTRCGFCSLLTYTNPACPLLFSLLSCLFFVLMALSTVFHSIKSPDNSPLSHSVLPVLFLTYWSFQLYDSLWKSPSALV